MSAAAQQPGLSPPHLAEHQHRKFMRAAIQLSERAGLVERTGRCFGAVVVSKDGHIIGEGYNQVVSQSDPTWHAETHAIRDACKRLGTPRLDGCSLYTSCYPCPMCTAAIYWARLDSCYYAASVSDISRFEPPGSAGAAASGYKSSVFNNREDVLPPEARTRVKFVSLMRDEAAAVFERYSQLPEADKASGTPHPATLAKEEDEEEQEEQEEQEESDGEVEIVMELCAIAQLVVPEEEAGAAVVQEAGAVQQEAGTAVKQEPGAAEKQGPAV